MPITRRAFGASLLATPALAQAQSQPWPNRPVRLISPFAPGGPQDVPGRFICEALTQRLGQPMVYDSRAGAGGAVGLQYVARETDGHTFLITSTAVATLPALRRDLGFDVFTDLLPVTLVMQSPFTIVVRANGPRSFKELLATARANPGKVTFGSSGVGSSTHLTMAMLMQKANLDMTHVPYRGGGQAMPDLIGGTVPVGFLNLPTVSGPAAAGRVKLLAVGSDTRVASRPEIPTVQESGVPNYAVRSWTGLFAPKNTPPAIVERVSAAMKEILDQPALKTKLVDGGSEPIWSSPADTDRFVVAEYARWTPVVKAANVKPE